MNLKDEIEFEKIITKAMIDRERIMAPTTIYPQLLCYAYPVAKTDPKQPNSYRVLGVDILPQDLNVNKDGGVTITNVYAEKPIVNSAKGPVYVFDMTAAFDLENIYSFDFLEFTRLENGKTSTIVFKENVVGSKVAVDLQTKLNQERTGAKRNKYYANIPHTFNNKVEASIIFKIEDGKVSSCPEKQQQFDPTQRVWTQLATNVTAIEFFTALRAIQHSK